MSNDKNKDLSYARDDKIAEERYLEFKEKDPFPSIDPALLNSADIADYVAQVGMIYPFAPERLGPASYEMVLGGEYLYWDGNSKKYSSKKIKPEEELTLRRNSITYVSVRELFRIPDYIGLRFNLRVKHVHRGLLLGTGPLIDPGFHGRLMIPIHNLTSNEYIISEGEKLISVEFTKISSNPAWKIDKEELKKKIQEKNILQRGEYVQNSGKNSKKSFEDLLKNELPIGTGVVVSSLSGTLDKANTAVEKNTNLLKKYKNISIGAAIALIIALFGILIEMHTLVLDANKYVSDAAMIVKKTAQEDIDIRNFVTREEIDSLKSDLIFLKKCNIELGKSNYIDNREFSSLFGFREKFKNFENKIKHLEQDIKELKKNGNNTNAKVNKTH